MARQSTTRRWLLLIIGALVIGCVYFIRRFQQDTRPRWIPERSGELPLQWNVNIQREQQLNIAADLPATKPPYRILCWLLTDPYDLERRTKYVRDTWARRCDKMLFMSSARNDSFPTIGLNVTAGRNHIAAKAFAAWLYIYEHHRDDAEYFLKGDPDTYFVIDNLRRYLATRDPTVPEFFGHRFFLKGPNVTYVSGGSGLVISRESLERLNYALIHTPACLPDGQGEDWKTARCMATRGVHAVDTRDVEGRETFMVFTTRSHMEGSYPKWYKNYDVNKCIGGPACCSRNPISFHYISQMALQVLDYYLHTVRGVHQGYDMSPLHFIPVNQSIPNPS